MDSDDSSGVPTLFFVLWIYYTILNFGDGLATGIFWLLTSFFVVGLCGMGLVKD